MNHREFFYLTAAVRRAQKEYLKSRDQIELRRCKVLEKQLDEEIERVRILTEATETATEYTY